MSTWVPTLGYDVAYIDSDALVLVRGGSHYNLSNKELPAWRVFARVEDLMDARKLAAAMNATVDKSAAAAFTQEDSEHG